MKPIRLRALRITGMLLLYGMVQAASAEGTLTVRTDPEGIEVWLGDKFLGQSPIVEKKVKAGRYELKLVDPARHTSVSEDVLIEENQPVVLDRTITSKFGSLKVTTIPEGAEVAIATELGKTPLSNDFMNPGRYRLEIRSPDSRHLSTVTEVSITGGGVATVNQKLKTRSFFTTRTIVSLCLTAGTAGGWIWGLCEQGLYRMYSAEGGPQSKIDNAALGRTLGIIVGSVCLIGLQIVVFF